MYAIFFDNKAQKVFWDEVLVPEIAEGVFSKTKIDRTPYIISETHVDPESPGITFPRQLYSFHFGKNKFMEEKGYLWVITKRLTEEFPNVSDDDLRFMINYCDYFVLTHPKDDNSTFKFSQVVFRSVNERNVPEDYRTKLKMKLEELDRKYGITELMMFNSLTKTQPESRPQVFRDLDRISKILKTTKKGWKFKESE